MQSLRFFSAPHVGDLPLRPYLVGDRVELEPSESVANVTVLRQPAGADLRFDGLVSTSLQLPGVYIVRLDPGGYCVECWVYPARARDVRPLRYTDYDHGFETSTSQRMGVLRSLAAHATAERFVQLFEVDLSTDISVILALQDLAGGSLKQHGAPCT